MLPWWPSKVGNMILSSEVVDVIMLGRLSGDARMWLTLGWVSSKSGGMITGWEMLLLQFSPPPSGIGNRGGGE